MAFLPLQLLLVRQLVRRRPQVMLAIKVRMRAGLSLDTAIERINALEVRIKTKFPEVAWCFVEPDVAD